MRAARITQSYNADEKRTLNYRVTDYDLSKGWSLIETDCLFHQFAQEGNGGETYVVAVVELDDGSVTTVALNALRFTE